VILRVSSEPHRDEARRAIEARWEDPRASEFLPAEIDRYQHAYASDEDKWFAAHAWLRLRDPEKAIKAAFGRVEDDVSAEDARRFGEMALRVLGWDDEARTQPSDAYAPAVLALVEGEDASARKELAERSLVLPLERLSSVLYSAMRRTSRPILDLMVHAFRERGEKQFLVAAAIASMGPDAYPERAADVALLTEIAVGTWRTTFNPTWAQACVALGFSEDPGGAAALREVATALQASANSRDARDLGVVRLGLLAAGDWAVEEEIVQAAFSGGQPDVRLATWYLEIVLQRHRRGDPRAKIQALWSRTSPGGILRERLAQDILLQAEKPHPDIPVDDVLHDLLLPEGSPRERIVGHSFRVRRGDEGARRDLLRVLLEMVQDAKRDPARKTQALILFVGGARALYLYA
jgi:hypothetical protein